LGQNVTTGGVTVDTKGRFSFIRPWKNEKTTGEVRGGQKGGEVPFGSI